MSHVIISQFKEKPKLKITWWAMGLGLTNIFGGPILGIFAAIVVPAISKVLSEKAASTIGFGFIFVVFGVFIATLTTSIISYRRGERSWAMWLGLIPAIFGCLFWVFMLVGELLFPH